MNEPIEQALEGFSSRVFLWAYKANINNFGGFFMWLRKETKSGHHASLKWNGTGVFQCHCGKEKFTTDSLEMAMKWFSSR